MTYKTIISKESNKYVQFKDDTVNECEVPFLYSNTSDENIINWINDYQYYGIANAFNESFKIIQILTIRK